MKEEPSRANVAKAILEKRYKIYSFKKDQVARHNEEADRQKMCINGIEQLFNAQTKEETPTLHN